MMSLTTNMKSALALMLSWVIFLLVGTAFALAYGPADIFVVLSLIVAIPYLVFFYYGRRGRSWAYLGSSALSVALVVATAASIQSGMPDILIWEAALSTILSTLIAVEGFKGYLDSKGPLPA